MQIVVVVQGESKKKAHLEVLETHGADTHMTSVFVNANEEVKLAVGCEQWKFRSLESPSLAQGFRLLFPS